MELLELFLIKNYYIQEEFKQLKVININLTAIIG